jgi:hypothetical protein
VDTASLRALFSKPYGAPAPTQEQWRALYADDVHFQDPTQERQGIAAYLAAQESLIRRCDDTYLTAGAIAIDGDAAFVEWEMGLKIIDHRDYFDFVGPTFEPVPVVGGFVRWLYRRFVD